MPGLRPDVVVRRQSIGNEVYFIIKDPKAQLYYRYLPDEWDIISGFDGTKTPEKIVDDFNRLHPSDPIDEETVESYRQTLKEMDLLLLPTAEKSLQFVERLREQRKTRAENGKWQNLFEITFSAWDPDAAFNRVIPHIRFLWSKPFLLASFAAIVMMAVINVLKWEEFKQGTIDLYTFTNKSLWDILVFIFLMTVTGTLHELGHGLTLKYHGGEVRQMGFLLFYLTPAFYCDVSDCYLLTNRKERLSVTFAGVYWELVLCSLATFVWFFAVPGTLVYDLAFKILLFTGISSFLINMNPLIKLDGYYALMDSLEVPDLREESFQYIGQMFKKLFGLQFEELLGLTRRKRKIYLIYGSLSILYTAVLYTVIVLWLRNVFLETFEGWGYIFLAAVVYFLFRKEIRGFLRFVRFLYLDKKEVLMKRKTRLILAASAGLLLLIASLFPTHTKISSRCVVEPLRQAEARPEVDGFVRTVLVRQNDKVTEGQEVARLENPELSRAAEQMLSELNLMDRQAKLYQSTRDMTQYSMSMRQRSETEQKKNELDRKLALLTLKSPITGTVVTPYVEQKEGDYLKRGDVLCRIDAVNKVKIEVPFREYYLEDVRKGQTVLLRLESYPAQTFTGVVQSISPAIRSRVEALEGTYAEFLATVVIDNANNRLIPGMRGDAKILAAKYTITHRVLRELRRWIQSRIW